MSANTISMIVKKHPCYSDSAHSTHGRIHLPVAPDCNLGCNYCERQIGGMTYHSYRPAATNRIISPKEALLEVAKYVKNSNLTVVGIAGPGEPLFDLRTFETLSLIHKNYPELLLCLSTNGLLLPEYAKTLWDLGVKTITVTLNTLDAEIGTRIYTYVNYKGKVLKGIDGTRILLYNQIIGIDRAVKLGFTIKVNSILIPGVNNGEMVKIAETAKNMGAYIQNITPLIPLGKFKYLEVPRCDELRKIRSQCEKIIKQFRRCQQCRADAVKIYGKEGVI